MVFTVEGAKAEPVQAIGLAAAGLKERQHLQEWVAAHPKILGDDVMIVTLEFGRWTGKSGALEQDRLDVLGLSRSGHLVVVELKRDRAPDTVDMQALKYAALVSRFTQDTLAREHAKYLTSRNPSEPVSADEAKKTLDEWSEFISEETLKRPRLVLMATEFPKTVITTFAFLHQELGLDVRLINFQAYQTKTEVVLTVSQFYPPPELDDFMLSPEVRQSQEKQAARQAKQRGANKVALLCKANVLDDGTEFRFHPPTESLRTDTQAWLAAAPARATATWHNEPTAPLLWAFDQKHYSPSGLTKHILSASVGKTGAVQGTLYWVNGNQETLAELADAIEEPELLEEPTLTD